MYTLVLYASIPFKTKNLAKGQENRTKSIIKLSKKNPTRFRELVSKYFVKGWSYHNIFPHFNLRKLSGLYQYPFHILTKYLSILHLASLGYWIIETFWCLRNKTSQILIALFFLDISSSRQFFWVSMLFCTMKFYDKVFALILLTFEEPDASDLCLVYILWYCLVLSKPMK